MALLHVICQSPFESKVWSLCQERMTDGDALLLVADAVYAIHGQVVANYLEGKACEVYVLIPDMQSRGVKDDVRAGNIQPVGFDGFVDLTVRYERIVTW